MSDPLRKLKPLLTKAGFPEEIHQEMVNDINVFSSLLIMLMRANEDVAPNYLTFALDTPEGKKYELTVRKPEGKTPCEVIDEKDVEIAQLRKRLRSFHDERWARGTKYIQSADGRWRHQ